MRDAITNSWIANAAAWSAAVREETIESRRAGTNAAILEAVLGQEPETVLDLGCGEGWLARALAAHGVKVTGIDGSPALIDAARELGGGEFLVLPYRELGSLNRTFDVAVANFSLFEEQLDDVLANVPAPVLIIQTIHPAFAEKAGWQVETFTNLPGDWPEPMPWYFRTLSFWRETLERAGFRIEETQEPRHAETGEPLSLMLITRRA